jgi:hypothetical protein
MTLKNELSKKHAKAKQVLLVGCRLLPTVAVVLLACMRELLRDIVMARLLRRRLRRRQPGKKRANSAPRMHSTRTRYDVLYFPSSLVSRNALPISVCKIHVQARLANTSGFSVGCGL